MKRKLLSMAVALLCSVGTWAQASYNQAYTEGVTVAAGSEYFLYNIGARQFYTGGMDWGTRASADHAGLSVTLEPATSGYFIKAVPFSANGVATSGYLSTDAYTDNNTETQYADCVFSPITVTGYTNAYTIKNGDNYLYYNTADTRVNWGESTNNNYSYWLIIPRSARNEIGDYTYYLQNTGINRPWERQVWCDYDWQQNNRGEWKTWTNNGWSNHPYYTVGGNDSNPCAEKYHNTYDFYQSVSASIPNGKYTLYAQGFYRQDDNKTQDAPVLYANNDNNAISVKTGEENIMADASTSFDAGNYVNQVSTVITDNKLRVGINITGANQWVIWDNFALKFLGTCLVNDAVEFTSGNTTAADTWYFYDLPATYEYSLTVSDATTLSYTTDGTQLTNEARGTECVFTASESKAIDLTSGRLYFKTSTATTLSFTVDLVAANKQLIADNKGDLTSLINGTFDENAEGWTFVNDKESTKTEIDRWNGSSWRGGNNYYADCNNRWYTISTTLNNMPAGSYKLVAAMRGKDFGIRPSLAGTDGSFFYGTNETMINTNGVQFPVSDITKNGMHYENDGTQWNWITLNANLAEDGDLVIKFKMEANDNCWACLDDVHLYCTELDGTSYTRTVGDGNGIINTGTHVVTADIVMENPNTLLRSTGKITTAAGEDLNNNQYNNSRITKLVLYDGYDYTNSGDNFGLDYGATLYRNIPADTWCTLVVPFYPNNLDVKKVPASLSDGGVLTFEDAAASGMNDAPMLVKSTAGVTAITGNRNSTTGVTKGNMTSGAGVNMIGTYSAISEVPQGSYVVARVNEEDKLYKVNSTVTLAPFRAYFSIPTDSPVKANVIALNFGDTETAIAEIENGEVKMANGPIFNLAGQRVNKAQRSAQGDASHLKKGIYIVNGKKVLVK